MHIRYIFYMFIHALYYYDSQEFGIIMCKLLLYVIGF